MLLQNSAQEHAMWLPELLFHLEEKFLCLLCIKRLQIFLFLSFSPLLQEPQANFHKFLHINLEYKVGTNYDVDDNGIETTKGIIDFTPTGDKIHLLPCLVAL